MLPWILLAIVAIAAFFPTCFLLVILTMERNPTPEALEAHARAKKEGFIG